MIKDMMLSKFQQVSISQLTNKNYVLVILTIWMAIASDHVIAKPHSLPLLKKYLLAVKMWYRFNRRKNRNRIFKSGQTGCSLIKTQGVFEQCSVTSLRRLIIRRLITNRWNTATSRSIQVALSNLNASSFSSNKFAEYLNYYTSLNQWVSCRFYKNTRMQNSEWPMRRELKDS